jgi:hypothetical protein
MLKGWGETSPLRVNVDGVSGWCCVFPLSDYRQSGLNLSPKAMLPSRTGHAPKVLLGRDIVVNAMTFVAIRPVGA